MSSSTFLVTLFSLKINFVMLISCLANSRKAVFLFLVTIGDPAFHRMTPHPVGRTLSTFTFDYPRPSCGGPLPPLVLSFYRLRLEFAFYSLVRPETLILKD